MIDNNIVILKRYREKFILLIAMVFLLAGVSYAGCASAFERSGFENRDTAGGKSLSREEAAEHTGAAEPSNERFDLDSAKDMMNMEKQRDVGQALPETRNVINPDPFKLVPSDWPGDIPFHDDGKVVDGGGEKGSGIFVLMLASSDIATPYGVLNFYSNALASWESFAVDEIPNDGRKKEQGSDLPMIIIRAERTDGRLEIATGPAPSGIYETLENGDHWESILGPDPVQIKLVYAYK